MLKTIENYNETNFYKNNKMKLHGNREFNIGDIVKFKCNNKIQYSYVKGIVLSGLNVIDVNILIKDNTATFTMIEQINPKHKGMINFSRSIYRYNN